MNLCDIHRLIRETIGFHTGYTALQPLYVTWN